MRSSPDGSAHRTSATVYHFRPRRCDGATATRVEATRLRLRRIVPWSNEASGGLVPTAQWLNRNRGATLRTSGRDVESVALDVVQGPRRGAERVARPRFVDPQVGKRHKAVHGEQAARPGECRATRVRTKADPDRAVVIRSHDPARRLGADAEGYDELARASRGRLLSVEPEAVRTVRRRRRPCGDVERVAVRVTQPGTRGVQRVAGAGHVDARAIPLNGPAEPRLHDDRAASREGTASWIESDRQRHVAEE